MKWWLASCTAWARRARACSGVPSSIRPPLSQPARRSAARAVADPSRRRASATSPGSSSSGAPGPAGTAGGRGRTQPSWSSIRSTPSRITAVTAATWKPYSKADHTSAAGRRFRSAAGTPAVASLHQ
ncbi:MAG TPA: hypothetical protein VFH45_12970 [Acidimicrobiales bacterium]|nr:hypothetical protein [Acidimicrobiales bacterium]